MNKFRTTRLEIYGSASFFTILALQLIKLIFLTF